ncbi:MAG: putative DNA binding domain-containing protein [Candidatus Eisenbacteria sp.]|nr:putative DNA binding domain-containing protein [Candidatus Eisenbacteria bacterium]
MKKTELLKRISEGEGVFQEFKTSLEKLDRTMVAFANAKGGIIYLGVDDDGSFSGLRITNRLKAQVQSISRNTDPPVEISCLDLDKALAIIVKEGEEKPYKCSDGFYLRSGATNQKLSRDEILDLAIRLNRIQFEALQVFDFRYPDDFSDDIFREFTERAHLGEALGSLGKQRFLVSLGVAEQQARKLIFNHTGVLLFGSSPEKYLPQAKTSYGRYRGRDKTNVIDRAIFSGSLTRQMDEALKKLHAQVPLRYRLADQSSRREIPAYPMRALEEALVNALIHRDYSEAGAEIQIDHFDDRIEITNPGSLLGTLTIETLKGKSRRRNPLIAELFFRIGKGEKLGSGIGRMQALMEEWKLRPPEFDASGDFFSVTFLGPGREIPEEKLLLLPSRPRQFMEAVNQIETPFTARTYAQRLSITPRTAQKDLQILIKRGLVSREGEGKNTRYRFC